MATLLYSPGIKVHIQTSDHGIIDVSDDLQNGSLTLAENQPSTFSFTLINHRRKYDGIFTPNDIITVQMKRIRWMPVFAGYLDQVPYFSVYPRNIPLKATDTLKRLKYRLWDPGSEAAVNLLIHASPNGGKDQIDGGMRDKLLKVLTDVADWDRRAIHVGRLPKEWAEQMEPLRQKLASELAIDPSILGGAGVANGVNPASAGTITVKSDGPGTGALPVSTGKVALWGGSSGIPGQMLLTGESRTSPADQWYCAMHWPFAGPFSGDTPAAGMSSAEYRNARRWWRNRKILVVNEKNNRAVVLRAADWGPGVAGASAVGISEHALKTGLRAKVGDKVSIRFVPKDSPVGRVQATYDGKLHRAGSAGPSTTPKTTRGSSGQGIGERITTDENLKGNVRQARAFIRANWSIPWGIGGYAPRYDPTVGTASEHYEGKALDVVVCEPGTAAQGADRTLGNSIALWFVQNPMQYNLKYVIWNDRINFGTGWEPYGDPNSTDHTSQHRDHLHLAFHDPDYPKAQRVVLPMPYTEPGIVQDEVT